MSKSYLNFVPTLIIALVCCASINAQDRGLSSVAGDRYVISARAGGVNHIEGPVDVVRNGRKASLKSGEEIEVGERVSTGADGRSEILLNPGSYMRLDSNSSFELETTSLDDLKIKLHRGSAMFEVFASPKFRVSVIAPQGHLFLVESGIYRIDVDADGGASVYVWDGMARLGDRAMTEVGRSRTGTIATGRSAVAKFDRDERSEFVVWSKTRGKELAKASKEIKDRAMRSSLINSFNGGRWGFYNSFGLWVHDASIGRYCFLPFGSGWYSPYGFNYGNSIYWYNLPPVIYQVQPTNPQNGIKTRARAEGDTEIDRGMRRPPFRQMETDRSSNLPVRQVMDPTRDRSPSPPTPVYRPAPVYVPVPANNGSRP